MKRKVLMLLITVLIAGLIGGFMYFHQEKKIIYTDMINTVSTYIEPVGEDTLWVPTFQLLWNDLVDNLAGGSISLENENGTISYLNQRSFEKEMINSSYVYTKYGIKNYELKKQIESDIDKRFHQTSGILEDFDWTSDSKNYFLYSMLYKEFKFSAKFEQLKNSTFGEVSNVKYFGIGEEKDFSINFIKVLYYENSASFAFEVTTDNGDKVIFNRGYSGSSFEEIYNNIVAKSAEYTGNRKITDKDELKIPYLNIKVKSNYDEITGVNLHTNNPSLPNIILDKAVQTIEIDLNEVGGKIKSESASNTKFAVGSSYEELANKRLFNLNNSFAMFIKESNKDVPYFAGTINNIEKYQ